MQEEQRNTKIAQLCDLIQRATDEQTELDKLVALSMKTGYELGRQTK